MRDRITKNAESNRRINIAGYFVPLLKISQRVALRSVLLLHRLSIEGFCICGKVGVTCSRRQFADDILRARNADHAKSFSASCRKEQAGSLCSPEEKSHARKLSIGAFA